MAPRAATVEIEGGVGWAASARECVVTDRQIGRQTNRQAEAAGDGDGAGR